MGIYILLRINWNLVSLFRNSVVLESNDFLIHHKILMELKVWDF